MKEEIVLLDLFSGIGGFSKGIEEAGFKIKTHYFSEIDNHAIANYKYNFKNAKYVGSVTNVRGTDIERPNIITFGSPCQDFSLAGKRTGMDGQRSSLISEAIRLISECRPDFFIWENVKGAFSSNNGRDFWAIIQAFTNIGGYRLEWQLLNTSWVLPQNRERIYLVGHLAEPGRNFRPVFPISETTRLYNQGQCEKSSQIASTLNAGDNKSWVGNFIKQVNDKKNFGGTSTKQQDRIYDDSGIMACLSSSRTESKVNIITRPHGFNIGNEVEISPTLKANSFEHNNFVSVKPVLTPDRLEKRQNGRRFKEDGEPAFTLNCQDQHGVMIDNSRIRRLTEIECERLQGFPDNWTKYGIYKKKVWTNKKENTFEIVEGFHEVPKTQRYKMWGNSVTVAIVKMIAERLLKKNHR